MRTLLFSLLLLLSSTVYAQDADGDPNCYFIASNECCVSIGPEHEGWRYYLPETAQVGERLEIHRSRYASILLVGPFEDRFGVHLVMVMDSDPAAHLYLLFMYSSDGWDLLEAR